MNSSPLFAVGLNTKIIGKCEPQKTSYAGAFIPSHLTMAGLAEHISKGHPWMPGLINARDRRWQQNVLGCEVVAIDIDDGLTIEQALEHPYVQAHAGLIIETSSSKPDHHKFRIVFRLPGHIQGWEGVRLAFRYLVDGIFSAADPACKDASRFFFGGLGRTARLLNEEARLPEAFLIDAEAWQAEKDAEYQKQAIAAQERAQRWVEENGSDPLNDAAAALAFVNPYTPGEGRYSSLIAMIGGVLNDFGSAGAQLLRGWGEAGKWGKSWDTVLRSVETSRPARPATISTLFHLAKEGGYRPAKKKRAARATKLTASKLSADNAPQPKVESEQKSEQESERASEQKPKLTATPGFSINVPYLPDAADELFPEMDKYRLVVVGAHCGTGKSQAVKSYLEAKSAESEELQPVIAISHRVSLGEAEGELLGLPMKAEIQQYGTHDGYILIADSAHSKSQTPFNGGAVSSNTRMFVDEADQVSEHMAHSTTAISRVRQEVIENIVEGAQRCKQVILASAGLTDLHVALWQQSMGISAAETLVIVNEHQRDMGTAGQAESPEEVWFAWDVAFANNEPSLLKLSGSKDTSLYSTETARRWAEERHPGKPILILDSVSCKDPSNPQTFIQAEVIRKGANGAYCCELIHTEAGFVAKTETARILSYLNHPCSEIKRFRQARIFGQYASVVFTNCANTGLSLEAGPFKRFFQIEMGAGSIDDLMQATARWRKSIDRLIFVKPAIPAPYGNGATDPLKLGAGKDKNWNSQIEALARAEVPFLPRNQLNVGGNLGQLWRNFCLHIEAERNAQASDYAGEYYDLLRAANYKVRAGFVGAWGSMTDGERSDFLQSVRDCRDGKSAANDQETSERPIEGKDLEKLEKKTQRTRAETQEIAKLKAIKRYGLEAAQVTPAVISAEKSGLYKRLSDRHYLELGADGAAQRDSARMQLAATHGRSWASDLLKGAQAYRVQLLQDVGLVDLLEHLRGLDADGNPNAIHKRSPEVLAMLPKLEKRRGDLKNAFRITVGKETKIFAVDGSVAEQVIEIERPIAIIQSLLKLLELNIKAAQKKVRIEGEKNPTGIFRLVDLLKKKLPDGSSAALIDYQKFKEIREAGDAELIQKAATGTCPEQPGDVLYSGFCALDVKTTEAVDAYTVEAEKGIKKCALDVYRYSNQASKAQPARESQDLNGAAGTGTPAQPPSPEPDYYPLPAQYSEKESPGLYRWGSSLSPWHIVSEPNEIGQAYVESPYGVRMVAQLLELEPWRELVPA